MINKKSILILYNPHRLYEGSLLEMLIKAIKTTDLEVEYIDITDKPTYKYGKMLDKIKNIYHRKVNQNNEYILKLENEFYNQYYLEKVKEFKKNNSTKFDYVLVIKPEEFTEKVIKEVTSLGNKSVGYIWDGLRLFLKPNLLKNIKYFDEVYSFDSNNIKDHPEIKLSFCTNFSVFNQQVVPYIDRKTDLFYIGDLAGTLESQRRDKKLSKLLLNISGKLDVNILFADNQKHVGKLNDPNIKYITSFIPMKDTFERTRNSKVVIDICKAHHIGLSFRFFECLATETKIITNNKDVVNYDFYNPNNIMIVDFENDILNEECFSTFLENPYEKVDQTILQKYSIENWIKYLFKEDKYLEISKE